MHFGFFVVRLVWVEVVLVSSYLQLITFSFFDLWRKLEHFILTDPRPVAGLDVQGYEKWSYDPHPDHR